MDFYYILIGIPLHFIFQCFFFIVGERPFQCTLCEKAFNQKSALQVHMKKHTGERPYKCDYCTMGFTQKSNMKLHMKRAHSYAGMLYLLNEHLYRVLWCLIESNSVTAIHPQGSLVLIFLDCIGK